MNESVELRAGSSRAVIAAAGGELHRWSVRGRELLWSRDPAWWGSSSPVLFPIVGWARNGMIMVDGLSRPMGVHGFAAKSRFEIIDRSPTQTRLVLQDTAASRDIYPFKFTLTLTYALGEDSLAIDVVTANTGHRVMPYAVGLHPAFRWPFCAARRDGHVVRFEHPERADVPAIAPGGLFARAMRPIPLEGRRLPLDDALFAQEALCFLNARSGSFSFESPDGASIELRATNFPHLAVWSKPNAPFLSMEVWTGHGDPEDFAGELAEKPSMRLLESGASDCSAVEFIFHRGESRSS